MAKRLIIVESPAKTKTLKNFLGPGYRVEASVGHVRDLPQRTLGVNVEKGFEPTYETLRDRRDVLKKLTEAAKGADEVYLATDPDREGEAISWHLAQALKLKSARRITFNEITKSVVEEALRHPREIDAKKVHAQEARRILDRLVGYRLSPLLSHKIRGKLSAGRVQSVAVRLVCDRERDILAFVPEEYWSLTAHLTPQPPKERFEFEARYAGRGKQKSKLPSEESVQEILRDLEGASYVVGEVKKREQRRNPVAPFITSSLQQEASRKLGMGSKRAMALAQQLYEGIEVGAEGAVGLITYMRTDSVRVSAEAQQETRRFLLESYGRQYVPDRAPVYKTKGEAQDAHEAIRPTSVYRTPESLEGRLDKDQLRLYRLVWQRFVASQMPPALFDVTTADILAKGHTFRATGSVLKFDGFLRVYSEGKDTEETPDEERAPLPPLERDQPLDLVRLVPKQHFTEPPPRFTEATLVKALEEKGIGRPSTYASIISTIQDREYVEMKEKRFHPTDLGFTVTDNLVAHFPDVMDVGFTAGMETQLDDVEQGKRDRVDLLREFYGPFDDAVNSAFERMERVKPAQVETEHSCPNCGKPMMLRQGPRGPFLGCSGYPKCKTVLNVREDGTIAPPEERPQPKLSDQSCPKCGKPLVHREGRLGPFLGCSGFPKCKTIVNLPGSEQNAASSEPQAIGIRCPKDQGQIVAKKTRYGALYLCSNEPGCDFKSWNRPLDAPCPECSWPLSEAAFKGRLTGKLKCTNPDCSHTEPAVQREAAVA